jgi:hypothetical protein
MHVGAGMSPAEARRAAFRDLATCASGALDSEPLV